MYSQIKNVSSGKNRRGHPHHQKKEKLRKIFNEFKEAKVISKIIGAGEGN